MSSQFNMTPILTKTLLLCSLLTSFYSFAQARVNDTESPKKVSGFLYGAGLTSSQEIYKGHDNRQMVIPLVGYKSEKLTVFGPFISYQVKAINHLKVKLKLSPRFQGFDASDSDFFDGMKERKTSLDAGFSLNYQKNDWKVTLLSMFDTLNRSNGVEVKSTVGHVFRFGPIFVEPSLSISYLDNDHVDYYYGVTESETNQFRTQFQGKEAKNIGLGLSIATPILLGGYTRLSFEYLWFDSAITNSPLVEDETSLSFQIFFTKMF
jgi:outer membrane protein